MVWLSGIEASGASERIRSQAEKRVHVRRLEHAGRQWAFVPLVARAVIQERWRLWRC